MATRKGRRVGTGKNTFALDVRKFAEATEQRLDLVLKKVTFDIFTDIVLTTPVDTGRARGSWTIGNNALPRSYNAGNDKGGLRALSQGQGRITRAKAGESLFIATNLAYMPFLEYGSSFQAPRGMVRIAARKYNRFMRQAIREVKSGRASFNRTIRG